MTPSLNSGHVHTEPAGMAATETGSHRGEKYRPPPGKQPSGPPRDRRGGLPLERRGGGCTDREGAAASPDEELRLSAAVLLTYAPTIYVGLSTRF